jgi:hypothetical protein
MCIVIVLPVIFYNLFMAYFWNRMLMVWIYHLEVTCYDGRQVTAVIPRIIEYTVFQSAERNMDCYVCALGRYG